MASSSTDLYTILREAGFTGAGLQMAYAIVMAESGGNAGATNTNSDSHHSEDRGLFQINNYWHPEVSDAQAFDPLANAKAAFKISDGGTNWSQWATYNNGSYKQYLGDTGATVSYSGAGGSGTTVMSTMRVGSSGGSVKQLQQKLGITADGVYGPQTEAAVRKYQAANKLTVDGIAGPQTLGSLGLSGQSTSSGSSGSGGASASSDDVVAELASEIGYSAGFVSSVPELEQIVKDATADPAHPWSQAKIQAAIQKTHWYQSTVDTQREWEALKYDDPATYQHQLQNTEHQLWQQAYSLGVHLSATEINDLAFQVHALGLSPEQVQESLAAHLTYQNGKDFSGTAGVGEDTLRQQAHDYGVALAPDAYATWERDILMGNRTADNYTTYLRDLAKSAFPALTPQLDQGMTVAQVADPYVQMMASTLEVPSSTIDFSKDPLIKKAFSYSAPTAGQDGKPGAPSMMPLWQFDASVKEDPRWLSTDNARNSLMDVSSGLLRDWGVTF